MTSSQHVQNQTQLCLFKLVPLKSTLVVNGFTMHVGNQIRHLRVILHSFLSHSSLLAISCHFYFLIVFGNHSSSPTSNATVLNHVFFISPRNYYNRSLTGLYTSSPTYSRLPSTFGQGDFCKIQM